MPHAAGPPSKQFSSRNRSCFPWPILTVYRRSCRSKPWIVAHRPLYCVSVTSPVTIARVPEGMMTFAACSAARAHSLDDAFSYLEGAVAAGFDNVQRLDDDSDLEPLRADSHPLVPC